MKCLGGHVWNEVKWRFEAVYIRVSSTRKLEARMGKVDKRKFRKSVRKQKFTGLKNIPYLKNVQRVCGGSILY